MLDKDIDLKLNLNSFSVFGQKVLPNIRVPSESGRTRLPDGVYGVGCAKCCKGGVLGFVARYKYFKVDIVSYR